ncbi:MAG: glycine cleavage system protein GcvH [Candidatus Omnitrophica bacterium]|nr:glycine cleavage system protein GcvH [Candidatus Omnitrophota bacterium]
MLDTEQRRYTKTHEWIEIREDAAYVGITDYAQEQITDVVFVELPKVDKQLAQGAEAAIVESVKSAFSIYTPVAGKIVRVNDALDTEPGLVNTSPYEDGWLFALKPSDRAQYEDLLDAVAYKALTEGPAHS